MTIVAVDVRVVRVPGVEARWNARLPAFAPHVSFVRVRCDGGVEGYASTWLPGPVHDVVEAVEQFVAPVVVGRSVHERGALWRELNEISYFFGVRAATSAFDIALWDASARSVGLPLWQFLGGARSRVACYASLSPYPTIDDTVDAVQTAVAEGFSAVKLHSVGQADLDIRTCRAVRAAVGDDIALMLDPVNAYRREEALRVGRVLDELGFAWFEAPLPDDDIEGYVALCARIDTPIANGEVRLRGLRDAAELVRRGAVDILRLAGDVQGGLTTLIKGAALAEAHGCRMEPRAYGSTLVQAAHLHHVLGVGNADWFEVPWPRSWLDVAMAGRLTTEPDGTIVGPAGPGLGVAPDWEEVERLAVAET
jgi:L-alanine-DL-glutamate epimerase-like enolase superfamily enzyme